MTSTIDPTKIGKPAGRRRHVRTLTGMYFQCHSSFRLLIIVATGYLPEKDASGKDKWPRGEEKVWREGMRTIDRGEFTTFVLCSLTIEHENTDVDQVTKSVVNHVQTSLARQCYNLGTILPFDPSVQVIPIPTHPDDLGAYQAAALAVRDDLLVIFCVSRAYI
jgi:starch phosphorylase